MDVGHQLFSSELPKVYEFRVEENPEHEADIEDAGSVAGQKGSNSGEFDPFCIPVLTWC
ncbi:hypothetical protein ACIQV3_12460 [Streptomyces sp. NPDC099050]|uniref:hypothetical protein n=1 Tax=Streptomyces sp. NPDC099050 TaxID=3366100 RepID=UPI00380C89ED